MNSQTVKFDPHVWGRLATLADVKGVTIPELIAQTAERLIPGVTRTPNPAKEARHEELLQSREAHRRRLVGEVLRLRKHGHTIQAIADITGYSKTYVSRILVENGHRTWSRSDAGKRRITQQEEAA